MDLGTGASQFLQHVVVQPVLSLYPLSPSNEITTTWTQKYVNDQPQH